ncbi:MAG: LamG-like jellyroll fold domain-containing protein [Phycisphaerales bacterium]
MSMWICTICAAAAMVQPGTPEPGVQDGGVLLRYGPGAYTVEGSTVVDGTGRVRARVVGNPKKASIGPAQGARFDGMGDWLEVREDIAVSKEGLPEREFTAAAWVCVTRPTEYGGIIGCLQDNGGFEKGWVLGYSTKSFYLGLSTNGADDGDGKMTYVNGRTRLEPGKWYHVAGTYDGEEMRLYVNGRLDGRSREQSGSILYPPTAPWTIACYKDADEFFPMDGVLHSVEVHGRAWPAARVEQVFASGAEMAAHVPAADSKETGFVVRPYLQGAKKTEMRFLWETARPGQGIVEYGEQLPYSDRTPPGTEGTMHEITVSGLKPGTPYFYRVRTTQPDGSEVVSDPLTFQTAVEDDQPYAFTIIGDTQKNKPVIQKLQDFAYTLRPNFAIHVGDVVNTGSDKSEWVDEYLPASWGLMSRVCLYPCIGNHEENHTNYYQYFSLPDREYRYTYTYGNAEFFVIDTNKDVLPTSEQYRWLDEQLGRSRAVWKFVYHHHPVYSSDENDYGDTYKGKSTFGSPKHRPLAALYEKHGVDMVFCGHIHSYERSWPIAAGRVDEDRGVRYLVLGGGGGGLEQAGPSRAWFTQRVYSGHHIGYVMIHDRRLQMQVFDLEGRLIDQFEVDKTEKRSAAGDR